jgi:hypothetical protein
MGWLADHRARKADRAEHKRAEEQAAALDSWQHEEDRLRELLDDARTNEGVNDGFGLILKKNERTFQVLKGSSLIEPRRLPGEWEGRSQGFSIPITKGVRYRVGSTKGHYVQGAEKPTPIDTGTVTITDQRVVFQGTTATREWTFPKLLGLQHVDDPKSPWTALQVSNRQKTSGFTYTADLSAEVRFRLDLALAHFHGEVNDFVGALETQIHEHELERPQTAPPASTADAAQWPSPVPPPTNTAPQSPPPESAPPPPPPSPLSDD